MSNTNPLSNGGLKILVISILVILLLAAAGAGFAVTYINQQQILSADRSIAVGDEFLSAGEYALAEEIYLETLGKSDLAENRLTNLYTRWANSLIAADTEPEAIIPLLEKLLIYTPNNMDVYYVIASLNRTAGNTAEAEAVCLRALEIDSANDKLIRYYGDLLLLRNDRLAAAAHYERSADITGNDRYLDLAKPLYPTAPVFSVENGSYSEHFSFDIFYEPSEDSDITAEDVTIYYTVESFTSDVATLPSFEYTQQISTDRFFNGQPLVISAFAVDKYGMQSQVSTVTYAFDMEYQPVTSLKLSKTSVKLEEGEKTTLRVTLNPSEATNKNVIFVSSDTNFVTVDENGFVTAVKFTANEDPDIRTLTEGIATITAISLGDGVIATCQVTVVPAKTAPSTSFNSSKKYLEVGLKAMQEVNPNVVGYIKMDNVLGVPNMPNGAVYFNESEPDFYLTHDSEGAESSYGEITVASGVRLSSLGRNTVITANYVSTGENNDNYLLSAVSDLDRYPAWYLDGKNHYVYFNTVDGSYIFQVFSWYHPDGSFTDYTKTEFATLDEFIDFCEAAEDAGQLYNTASPSFYAKDRILTLIIYKDGEVDTVMHCRAAKYKSTTTGISAFFEDGLGQTVTPVDPETPVDSEIPEENENTDTPEEVENNENTDQPDESEVPDEPQGIEGDLDGDGVLSFTEKYLLQLQKDREEAENTESTEEGSNE